MQKIRDIINLNIKYKWGKIKTTKKMKLIMVVTKVIMFKLPRIKIILCLIKKELLILVI